MVTVLVKVCHMISVISAAVAMGVLVVGRPHFADDLSDAMCAILRITISRHVLCNVRWGSIRNDLQVWIATIPREVIITITRHVL